MGNEKIVSIVNISGPANVGKTLACTIGLRMMESPGLILSRCTMSSMLDYPHVFNSGQGIYLSNLSIYQGERERRSMLVFMSVLL